MLEVVVHRELDGFDAATHVDRMGGVHQVVDGRVLRVRRAEHELGLTLPVGTPHVLDVEHGEHHALVVAQRHALAGCQLLGSGLRDVEGDRHRPQRAVGEPHRLADRVVLALGEEAAQRREGAVGEQLEVADLTGRQVPRREVDGYGLQLGGAVLVDQKVDELTAVWCDQLGHGMAPGLVANEVSGGRTPKDFPPTARPPTLGEPPTPPKPVERPIWG